MSNHPDRRQVLKVGASLSALGVGAPFALQLAAAGSAAAQSAGDYKALVCIFLFGGNDSHNTVLATDADTFGRYYRTRNTGADPIALLPPGSASTAVGATSAITGRVATAGSPDHLGGVLPIVPKTAQAFPAGTVGSGARTFALHPSMGVAKGLFDAGRLGVVANLGTLIQPTTKAQYQGRTVAVPRNLFSHNDQQSTWQAGAVEGVRSGWGGRMGDMIASANGANALFTAISTAGNAVFLSGQDVIQYQMTTAAAPALVVNGQAGGTLFGSALGPARLREIMQDVSSPSLIAADYGTVVGRSAASAGQLNTAFAQPVVTSVAAIPAYTNPASGLTETNSLAVQLQTVARMIAASGNLGLKRQVFFVSLGGWDNHDFQNRTQANNLGKVSHALAYFDAALSSIGGQDHRSRVTAFTASDFSRTFNTNGDGTDHAWGGHHFVWGGAVKGGDIYGQYPTLGTDVAGFSNPNQIGNYLVPTTSVDQYAATLGGWFGVSPTDLNTIFPNLKNFAAPNLGFV